MTHIKTLIARAGAAVALLLTLFLWLPTAALAQTATSPQTLTNGVSAGPLADVADSKRYYVFNVPAGATLATFATTGSTGDVDMYVRYGAVPNNRKWDYRPYQPNSNESVSVSNPRAGAWYVMLRGNTAYSGVYLKATHNASVAAQAAMPTFSPAPGSYSGQVNVALASSTPGAQIRFTTNGSTPTEASEVYNAPIIVTSTTTVKAVAFASGYSASAVASGTYTISNSITTLTNDVAVANLSGVQGSTANFKFAVPAGSTSATITISGGTGDADLYVKYGQLATLSVWDQRPYTGGNNETVYLTNPAGGDYYIMIHGYAAYSGLTIKASYSTTAVTGKPDLLIWGPATNAYVTTETFASTSCDVQEGTITAGTKKLLRFTSQSRNIGTADLVLGNPANNPSFEWGACHGHYHFRSFAQYRLLDTQGGVVRTGRKVGFCLMDITRISDTANPSARYTCSNQGIQAGWADIYSANLSGQWIDITGLPSGNYVLEIVMDPMNLIDESDETNNTTRVNVSIP